MIRRLAAMSLVGVFAFSLMLMSLTVNTVRADNPTATPAPTATPVVADVGTGSVKLTYWNGLTGGDGDVMQKMIQAFAKDNPDISIHAESYLWDIMFQKLTAAFVAGEPPDVFVLHTQDVPQFASLGVLRESDDMYDTNGGPLPMKDYSNIDATVYKGKHYGVLLDNHGFGTWVNLNLFKTAGVDENTPAPKNADEYIKLATKLTLDANGKHPDETGFDVKNVKQWGTGIDWIRVQWESFLFQFGGQMVSQDGKTGTVNSDAGKQALNFMHDMIYKYHIAPDPTQVNGYNAFQAGQIAIMPSGTWFRDVLVDQHPEIKWTAWPMIQVGTKPAVWVSAHVMFIASSLEDATKLAAAKKFIQYLTENDAIWAQSGHVPARISHQGKLDVKTYPSNITFGKTFQEYGTFEPQNENITEIENALDPELAAALNNQKTVDQALNDANTRIQTVLDRQTH